MNVWLRKSTANKFRQVLSQIPTTAEKRSATELRSNGNNPSAIADIRKDNKRLRINISPFTDRNDHDDMIRTILQRLWQLLPWYLYPYTRMHSVVVLSRSSYFLTPAIVAITWKLAVRTR